MEVPAALRASFISVEQTRENLGLDVSDGSASLPRTTKMRTNFVVLIQARPVRTVNIFILDLHVRSSSRMF